MQLLVARAKLLLSLRLVVQAQRHEQVQCLHSLPCVLVAVFTAPCWRRSCRSSCKGCQMFNHLTESRCVRLL